MSAQDLRIVNLAQHPQLVTAVGQLRWREWREDGEDATGWIQVTMRESGTSRLPITLAAVGPEDEVWGAVALGDADDALTDSERSGRRPWLLGLVIDPAHRRQQVGRRLVAAIERLAADRGHEQVWVATGDQANEFYRRCGWVDVEVLLLTSTGDQATILRRQL